MITLLLCLAVLGGWCVMWWFLLTPSARTRAQGIERFRYRPLGTDLGPSTLPEIEEEMRRNPPRGAHLIMTKGRFVFAESFLGKPPGWGEDLERRLVSSGRFRLVHTNAEARVYVLASAEGRNR